MQIVREVVASLYFFWCAFHVIVASIKSLHVWFLEPANLNPEELPKEVRDLPKGVYFGWVQVRGEGLDSGVHKMVMNIGNRPTFADSGAVSVVSVSLESHRRSYVSCL